MGILITLVSNFCYVAAWEVAYFKFMPDFADKYAAHMVERGKASGESEEKIERATRQAQQFKEMYRKPVVNVALTFAEVFPIGLAVTLVSAATLRKNRRPKPREAEARRARRRLLSLCAMPGSKLAVCLAKLID